VANRSAFTAVSARSEVDSVAVLIPALNCEGTIAGVVADAQGHTATVLVVDDGSVDDTAEMSRRAGAAVVSHPVNLGKGAALSTGMRVLFQKGCSHVVTMDGDGQHLAGEIPLLMQASVNCPEALVVGARRVESQRVAGINLFGNRFADRCIAIACGQSIRDTQSGFRVYPLARTLSLGVRSGRFAFETEVLVRAARARIPIISVPVQVHYPPPEERLSHYRKVRDTARIVLVVLGLMLRVW
jgi:glycosyltransferase involved in cell wall biosynthesis